MYFTELNKFLYIGHITQGTIYDIMELVNIGSNNALLPEDAMPFISWTNIDSSMGFCVIHLRANLQEILSAKSLQLGISNHSLGQVDWNYNERPFWSCDRYRISFEVTVNRLTHLVVATFSEG